MVLRGRSGDAEQGAEIRHRSCLRVTGMTVRNVGTGERLRAFFRERYLTVDVRWLGVFRLALGTLLMVEVLRRWYYAVPFYTNEGLLPNHFTLFAPMGGSVFSIYHAFSTYPEVSVAFFATLLVFLAFTLGYRTRLFHVLSAVCITSLNARNLFVQNGGT